MAVSTDIQAKALQEKIEQQESRITSLEEQIKALQEENREIIDHVVHMESRVFPHGSLWGAQQ